MAIAIGHPGGGISGIAVAVLDVLIDELDVEIAISGIGQDDLKGIRARAGIGGHIEPGGGKGSGGGVEIPVDVTALADIHVGPERHDRGAVVIGQTLGVIGGLGCAEGQETIGIEVETGVAGSEIVDPVAAKDGGEIDIDAAVIEVPDVGPMRAIAVLAIARGPAQAGVHSRHIQTAPLKGRPNSSPNNPAKPAGWWTVAMQC